MKRKHWPKEIRLQESDDSENKVSQEEPQQAPLSFTGEVLESHDGGRIWEVTLIRSGWSKNGVYYSPEALREALPLFAGIPIAIYTTDTSRAGHLDRSDRFAGEAPGGNVAGFAVAPRLVEVSGGVEVRADYHCTHDQVRQTLLAAERAGAPFPLGFSIDGWGERAEGVAEGRRGLLIKQITKLAETTLVSNPAAGGRVVRLVASTNKEDDDMNFRKAYESWLRRNGRQVGWMSALSEAHLMEAFLREGVGDKAVLGLVNDWIGAGKVEEAQQLLSKLMDSLEGESESPASAQAMPVAEAATSELSTVRAELEKTQKLHCKILLESALQGTKLPDSAQAHLRKQFEGKVFAEQELAEAIDDLRNLLGQPLAGVEQPTVRVGAEKIDRLQAEFDLAAGYRPDKAALSESEKDLYREATRMRPSIRRASAEYLDDPELSGRCGENAVLAEATSSNYPLTLANSLNRAMIQMYGEYPDPWEQIVQINPNVDDFRQHTKVLMGGFSGISVVGESDSADTYAFMAPPAEAQASYSVSTRGGMFALTRKMMKNDDLQAFARIPQLLARGCRHELRQFVWKLLIAANGGTVGADTVYDGVGLFHASHFNRTTDNIGHDPVVNAWLRLGRQRNLGTSTTLGGDVNNSATEWTVGSTRDFKAGQLLKIGGELVTITSVTNTTTVVVARGAKSTTAASHTSGATIWQLVDPIAVRKAHLVTPQELSGTAWKLISSELVPGSTNNDANMLKKLHDDGKLAFHYVDSMYLAENAVNWFLFADPMDAATAEIAFMDNRRVPEILVQDNPTVGFVFTRDNITMKCRHEYGGALLDWVGAQAGIPA